VSTDPEQELLPNNSMSNDDMAIQEGQTAADTYVKYADGSLPMIAAIGKAISIIEQRASYEANGKTKGKKYNDRIKDYLVRYGFDRIHRSVRSRMKQCYLQHDIIVEWHHKLSTEDKRKLNTPQALLARFRKDIYGSYARPRSAKDEIIADLENENHQLKQENRQLKAKADGGNLFSFEDDKTQDIATTMLGNDRTKAINVAYRVLELAHEPKPSTRIKRKGCCG
jgi:hypothetical protein